jgi:hypothetical protein
MQTNNAPSIACSPDAVPAEQRTRWVEAGTQVYASVQEIQELPDGFRFRLPTDSALLLTLADYIANERLSCAFLHFTVEIEPEGEPFWLRLTGGEGVKAYIRSVFQTTDLLNERVAKVFGLR